MAVETAGRAPEARGYIAALPTRQYNGPDPVSNVRCTQISCTQRHTLTPTRIDGTDMEIAALRGGCLANSPRRANLGEKLESCDPAGGRTAELATLCVPTTLYSPATLHVTFHVDQQQPPAGFAAPACPPYPLLPGPPPPAIPTLIPRFSFDTSKTPCWILS